MFFQKHIQRLKRFESNIEDIILGVLKQSEVESFIVELNEKQLDVGIDSNGDAIRPPYTQTTIRFKIQKGQQFRWVTLKDTGKFRRSFDIIFRSDEFEIIATDQKTRKLKAKYGPKILGLTTDSIDELIRFVQPKIKVEFERAIFGTE